MMQLKKMLLLMCLTIISTALDIGQWVLKTTISQCTKHFQINANYNLAVCANTSGVHAYKWSSSSNSFIHFQLISTSSVSQISMSSDGSVIALPSAGILHIYRKSENQTFYTEMLHDQGSSTPNFQLTDNSLYFTQQSFHSGMVVGTFNSTSNIYNIAGNQLECNTSSCDSAISEDGTILIISKPQQNITVYKKDSLGIFQEVATNYEAAKPNSMVANIHNQSQAYIACINSNLNSNVILKYNGTSETLMKVFSFQLLNGDNQQTGGDKAAISSDNRWFAFLQFSPDSNGYSLVQHYANDSYDILGNNTHWQSLFNASDISFRHLTTGQMTHTITSAVGTLIYLLGDNINCSQITNSTGEVLEPLGCVCVPGYSWNQSSIACEQISCSEDPHSNGTKNSNQECVCVSGYQWDENSKQCSSINCSNKNHSSGGKKDNGQCGCIVGYEWKQIQKQCEPINCSNKVNSTGTKKDNGCECIVGFDWNEMQKQCKQIDCSQKDKSTGNIRDSVCECIVGYEWNQIQKQCGLIDCSQKNKSTGIIRNSVCECIVEYQWNQIEKQCNFINCSGKSQSTGTKKQNRQCQCIVGYEWSEILKKCILVNCSDKPQSTGIIKQNGQCECVTGYEWTESLKDCEIIDCSIKTFSTGNRKENHQCQCKISYEWDENQKQCLPINCSQKESSTGQSEQNQQCKCETEYEWEEETKSCKLINCSDKSSATGTKNKDKHCNCVVEYEWSEEQKQCIFINCSSKMSSTKNKTEQGGCECVVGFMWDKTMKFCGPVNCSSRPHSTGVKLSNGECQCPANFQWNNTRLTCECIKNYEFDQATQSCLEITSETLTIIFIAAALGILSVGSGIAIIVYCVKKGANSKLPQTTQYQTQIQPNSAQTFQSKAM